MRPGRELDVRIAKEVFGHNVWAQNKELFENAEKGDRPLRKYSKDIEWAMEVAKKMKVALLPVAGGDWFAFVGPEKSAGWESPQAMLQFLEAGNFNDCGAAVGTDAAKLICEAALKAVEKRQAVQALASQTETPEAADESEQHASLSVVPNPSEVH
jgi:hypothetical protein